MLGATLNVMRDGIKGFRSQERGYMLWVDAYICLTQVLHVVTSPSKGAVLYPPRRRIQFLPINTSMLHSILSDRCKLSPVQIGYFRSVLTLLFNKSCLSVLATSYYAVWRWFCWRLFRTWPVSIERGGKGRWTQLTPTALSMARFVDY